MPDKHAMSALLEYGSEAPTTASIPPAYLGRIDWPCATCGVAAGEFCLAVDDRILGPRRRRVPCVRRRPPSQLQLDLEIRRTYRCGRPTLAGPPCRVRVRAEGHICEWHRRQAQRQQAEQ